MKTGFCSVLADDLSAFLEFKRGLGCPYRRAEHTLLSFDRFAKQRSIAGERPDLKDLTSEWLAAQADRKPVSVTNDLGVIRQLCLFLRRRDPNGFVPGRHWAPQPTKSDFLPYIFSHDEMRILLGLTESLSGAPLRPAAYRALILILYCTGLRVGEAVRLSLPDVDLAETTIRVRHSKGRSRWVPFGEDLAAELQRYLDTRASLVQSSPSGPLFIRLDGDALSVPEASRTLRNLFRTAGFKPSAGRIGPRPYDLRHTFAVHRLARWYHEGVDINARLPWLSAYMGHINLLGTEVYLRATPELLELAAQRFQARLDEA